MQLCCIPLRHLRDLRENNTQEYSINCTNENPMYPADLADLRRQTTKHRTTIITQSVFLCVIMQPAAFLCVICVICGRIHARGLKQSAQMKPQCLPQISQIYADKPQNHNNIPKLSFSAK